MPNKDKNIPKRRFKAFENADAWELRKLGEVADVFDGTHQTPKYTNHGVMFLSVEDIATLKSEKYISLEDFEKEFKIFPEFNDVLMTRIGDIGTSNIVKTNDKIAYYVSLALIKPRKLESHFLNSIIQSKDFQNELWKRTLHIAFPKKINKGEISEVNLKFPSLPEQEAIGTFFSTLDRHITLHQRKLDKLKNVKQAYLSEMFPAEGERVPKRRFPGFTDAWELRKLGELTSYRNGKGYEDNQSDFGKYELINLNSISIEGGLKPSGKFINSASETLNKNDLVMVLSDVGHGDLLGRVAIIPEDDRFVLNQRVALLRNNDYADCKYLFSYINANQHYFKLQGAGSSQLNISKKAVENFVVHIPSPKEQSAIGTFFSTLDRHITLHQRKLEKLKNLKKALLNELFV
ncbi:restriction endonuclease subunit S [Streptococcus suis]|nr:restriction endonuclease subunit S [Streptococcus suis]